VDSGFIFDRAPFPSAHASTLAETRNGTIVAAWFAGTREKHRDVGIWLARREGGIWSPPVEVADGVQSWLRRYPCWNPVLHQLRDGPLLLFYKVGKSPSRWWGMVLSSTDGGEIWSEPRRLPEGILGPIKNKPIELDDGTLLCPSSSEHAGWRVHMEWSRDGGESWETSGPLNSRDEFRAIQPAVLAHSDDRLQILCRSRQGAITECWSDDGGRSWSKMQPTDLPNPDSGIDAVMLRDGRVLLIYNHSSTGRTPINLAFSRDGKAWQAALELENNPGEFSYPAIIETKDRLVHISYTWNRTHIKYLTLDPRELPTREIRGGVWPE